ncbi:MAG: hypothetical protein RLZZ09_3284 [Pseudomonadota bacterium]|jgi:hypothetical protein
MSLIARSRFVSSVEGASQKPRAEFIDIVSGAATALVSNHPRPVWRDLLREVVAPDFKSFDILNAIFCPRLEEIAEHQEYSTANLSSALLFAQSAIVKKYGVVMPIDRVTVINDRSLGFLADMVNAMVAAAYRREGDAVFAALNDNANLSDGSPWFTAENSVLTPSVAAAILSGMEALRSQAYPDGQLAHLEPFALVVPAGWYVTMDELNADFLGRPPLIIRSAALTDGFVFADPQFAPTMALMSLVPGATPEVTSTQQGKHDYRDLHAIMKVRHEFAIAPLSRTGVVRMSVESA